MLPQMQSLSTLQLPYVFPTSHLSTSISFSTVISATKQFKITHLNLSKKNPSAKLQFQPLKCSVSVLSERSQRELQKRPSPAEVSRTILELSSIGTLSTLTQEGWPLGVSVRFAVDPEGTPILCLTDSNRIVSADGRSSLHVQMILFDKFLLEQCGLRALQCTLQGSLRKPEERIVLKKLESIWVKRFGEEVNEDSLYVIDVERVLQMGDQSEDGVWVASSEYRNANPDPLRDVAEKIVSEINAKYMEDVHRVCNIYVNLDFQISEAKMVWVDRLGFDMHLYSRQKDTFEVRILFPREVSDEKSAKSSFNCMAQLAWEAEKNYPVPGFEKVKLLKQIRSS